MYGRKPSRCFAKDRDTYQTSSSRNQMGEILLHSVAALHLFTQSRTMFYSRAFTGTPWTICPWTICCSGGALRYCLRRKSHIKGKNKNAAEIRSVGDGNHDTNSTTH